MFSWLVGQTQAHAGARIPSTNTDGLYTIMEEEANNKLLEEVSKKIRIRIDPEVCLLISKDTNNRMEVGMEGKKKRKILDAKGGSLSCYQKPELEQSLSHPAILDYALTQYLPWAVEHGMLDKPADPEKAREIIEGYSGDNWMLMFQNIVASSPGTDRYVYAVLPDREQGPGPEESRDDIIKRAILDKVLSGDPEAARQFNMYMSEYKDGLEWEEKDGNIIYHIPGVEQPVTFEAPEIPEEKPVSRHTISLQHYNRVFYMKDPVIPENGTKNITTSFGIGRGNATCWLQIASGKKITPAERKKRIREKLPMFINDPEASDILRQNDVDVESLNRDGKNAAVVSIPGIKSCLEKKPTECLILNEDLRYLSKERQEALRENLDYDYYIQLFMGTYEDNWMNHMPPEDWDPSRSALDPVPETTEREAAADE